MSRRSWWGRRRAGGCAGCVVWHIVEWGARVAGKKGVLGVGRAFEVLRCAVN